MKKERKRTDGRKENERKKNCKGQNSMGKDRGVSWKDVGLCAVLAGLAVFFCWFEVGRYGVLGSNVDWISQHSVIPEYFRQQFYETGKLLPEFALGLGGGQNAFCFAYYGLASPLILPSYLLPSVRMGDYLMAVSVLTVAATAVLCYGWLRHLHFSRGISFWCALMLTLSGPLIFQSARQVMFVDYLPFLCLALWGVDRYLETGRAGLYIAGVFLMIMTSFLYSICGMLVLVLYGVHRYLRYMDGVEELPEGTMVFGGRAERRRWVFRRASESERCIPGKASESERCIPGKASESERCIPGEASESERCIPGEASERRRCILGEASERRRRIFRRHAECVERGRCLTMRRFLTDGVRFLLPLLAAVLMSAVLLVPAAAALLGKRGGRAAVDVASLLLPELAVFRNLYSAYGTGLTTLAATALLSGLFWRRRNERVLVLGCLAVFAFPIFLWLLNGGLYVREKALIPFVPLLVYVIAYYCRRLTEEGTEEICTESGRRIRRKTEMVVACLPYLLTIYLLWTEAGYELPDYLNALQQLPESILSRGVVSRVQRWTLVLLDAAVMLVWFLLWRLANVLISRRERRRRLQQTSRAKACGNCSVQKDQTAYVRSSRKQSCLIGQSVLLIPPVLFLILFGGSFHGSLSVVNRDFYEKVNDTGIGEVVQEVLEGEDGLYRMEQWGTEQERAANINRVWDAEQYVTSVYSSAYNPEYQDFRMETFDVEEPAGNFMMQRVSENPVFRRLMGVKYLVDVQEESEKEPAPGYELFFEKDGVRIYRNPKVAPICYATDRVISQEEYESLEFPCTQTVFDRYAVVEDVPDEKVRAEKLSEPEEPVSDNPQESLVKEPVGDNQQGSLPEESVGDNPQESLVKEPVGDNPQESLAEESMGDNPQESLSKELVGDNPQESLPKELVGDNSQKSLPNESVGGTLQKSLAEDMQKLELSLPELTQDSDRMEKTEDGYLVETKKSRKIRIPLPSEACGESAATLYLRFEIENLRPAQEVAIRLEGVKNTLSSHSGGYFYYNKNTIFTYAIPLSAGQTEVEMTLGAGRYRIRGLDCFVDRGAAADTDTQTLYQSELIPDQEQTKGNRIAGSIDVDRDGYVITSIPYDQGFTVKVDGNPCAIQRVNTAFLGFPISSGHHTVEICYHAPGLRVGKVISVLGLFLALFLVASHRSCKFTSFSQRPA